MPAHVAPLAAIFNLPTFWICVWIGLLTATVAIVWLLRTKLHDAKPNVPPRSIELRLLKR